MKKEFIGLGLHLRPVHADHAQPLLQWTLHFRMYYELCNPKVGVVLPNWQSESQGATYPHE